jgi:hypothetical protein
MTTKRRAVLRRGVLVLTTLLWVSGIAWGLTALARHETTPGKSGLASDRWPSGTSLARRSPNTLVVFAHPRCPCTRATLEELEKLMAHSLGSLTVTVAFFAPEDATPDWTATDLWRQAARIPGVETVVDRSGVEAERFGALTSGDTFLYDARGSLVFRGGMTASRGHSGDNVGRSAIEAFVLHGKSDVGRTQVFGCPIHDDKARSAP